MGRPLARYMPERALQLLEAGLWNLGYAPIQAEPVDYRGLAVRDPLDAWRRGRGRAVLVDVAPERCRTMDVMSFACSLGAPHPYVLTAAGILDGSVTCYEDSPLRTYYSGFQPRFVYELYGWDAADVSAALKLPVLCAANPWGKTPGPHMEAIRRRVVAQERAEHGGRGGSDNGHNNWGPVGIEKAELEFRRLKAVVTSIQTRGYRPGEGRDGHIRGRLLVSGDRSMVRIGGGQHRMAALTALRHPTVPVLIYREVPRRETVDAWPGVRSGAFTREQALEAFDIAFEGRRPPRPGCLAYQGVGG